MSLLNSRAREHEARAKELLIHYLLNPIHPTTWSRDNSAEVEAIVDGIIAAVIAEIRPELRNAFDSIYALERGAKG